MLKIKVVSKGNIEFFERKEKHICFVVTTDNENLLEIKEDNMIIAFFREWDYARLIKED